MKIDKNKSIKTKSLIAMILMIVLAVPMMIQVSQITVQALTLPTILLVTAEPNPVGVGQAVFISIFMSKPIPTTGGQLYEGLTINVVKPDGTNQTFGPYTADTTGGVGGTEFTPTVAGNYSVQGFYPGQKLGTGEILLGDASDVITFTVQTEPITSYVSPPLPTEYWSRPIYAINWNWAALGGNWWGLGKPSFTDTGGYDGAGNNFNPYSLAPNSGHIMWVKPAAFGGQPGEPITGNQESQYTSTSILYRQFEPVILNGIIYYKLYPNTPTTYSSLETPGWNAVDLRTGELIWHKDTSDTLDFGFVMFFHTIQEYGTQAFLMGAYNSSMWQLFDPLTGYLIANITNVPNTVASGIVDAVEGNAQGAVLIPTITSGNLTLWNSTRMLMSSASSSTIRPSGNINYTRGIQYTTQVVNTSNGNHVTLSIGGYTREVVLLRYAPTVLTQSSSGYVIEAGYNLNTGALLWGPINRTVPLYADMSLLAKGEGVYVTHDKDRNEAYGFSLDTGKQLWGPVVIPGSALSRLERGGAIAYEQFYIWDFGGWVSALDLQTGHINWTLEPNTANYDTPYGIYPIWHFGSHSIADGKLFLSQARMYDPPLFPNAHKLAINTTDGSLVWSEMGFFGREPSIVADGYMVGYNSYDAQIYTWGKGQTATTAAVQQNVVASGSSVLITGTVMDKAPGTKDSDRVARFPNGVAAVSDDSQSNWMEYVYMQQPKPTNATGVTVSIDVMDSNGNYRNIGTTTSDTSGAFSFQWTPDISGKYTVFATFGGSQSYWSSQATTAFAVDEPHPTTAPTEAPAESVADMYFVPAIAGLFIAIIVVGLLNILFLRKRP